MALDQQQALLIGVLRRARGGPVSYAELRDAGVEYPASVVSELELAGLPLERSYEGPTSGRRLLGVRLDLRAISPDGPRDEAPEPTPRRRSDSASDPPAAIEFSAAVTALRASVGRALARAFDRMRIVSRAAGDAVRATAPMRAALLDRARRAIAQLYAPQRRWSPRVARLRGRRAARAPDSAARARWLAPAALIAAAALLAALAVDGLTGEGHRRVASAGHVSRTTSSGARAAGAPSTHPPSSPPHPSSSAPATPVSPALAAQLEARGHELLDAGELERAIPVLGRALAATGESLDSCLQPVGETCLNYAYALYDLGRALRLDRQPAAAVLTLERRLQIDNQRATVRSELDLARREAGRQAPIASASG